MPAGLMVEKAMARRLVCIKAPTCDDQTQYRSRLLDQVDVIGGEVA